MENTEALSGITAEQLAEARGWISDCYWGDLDDVDTLDDVEVFQGVSRHYEGGWPQFIRDTETSSVR